MTAVLSVTLVTDTTVLKLPFSSFLSVQLDLCHDAGSVSALLTLQPGTTWPLRRGGYWKDWERLGKTGKDRESRQYGEEHCSRPP